jgi:two-component system, cell cycle response regulator DivK
MANESILVVDDVPVNLKLTDLLLRREGFKVHTTPDAEQALALLRGFQPDLMLVDIELPGMDGLTLTRRIRQNPATRDMVVVALSAHAASGDYNHKALEAGCDGYITKPIDSATLISSIRNHLRRHATRRAAPEIASVGNPPAAAADDGEEDLETLQRRFLEEGALQSQQMLGSLHQGFDAPKAARLCHQWVGAAGILGYLAISHCARQAEEVLSVPAPDTWQVREALSDLVASFAEPRETAKAVVPASVSQAVSGKPIALVGFRPEEAEGLCGALETAGARPRVFRGSDAPDSPPVADCSAVLLAVCPEMLNSRWMAAGGVAAMEQPLLLAGKREQIMALDATLQSRASEFLIDGWQPEEALMRLSFALSRDPRASVRPVPSGSSVGALEYRPVTGPPQILIADDDATVRSLVRLTLQDYGMECRMASNGPEALQMIRDHELHAALLDVNMPGMDGYLVLAAVRDQQLPVRVILLTARRHENDVSRGFTLGADDYVVKPFNSVELVARLKRLFRR